MANIEKKAGKKAKNAFELGPHARMGARRRRGHMDDACPPRKQ